MPAGLLALPRAAITQCDVGHRGTLFARGILSDDHACAARSRNGDAVTASKTDVWHFVCDERKGLWSWKRVAADGDEVARAPYSFASFNVCVADAERAGFINNTAGVRRVRDAAGDTPTPSGLAAAARRRRSRTSAR